MGKDKNLKRHRARVLSSVAAIVIFVVVWLSFFLGREYSTNGKNFGSALLSVAWILLGLIPFLVGVFAVVGLVSGFGPRQWILRHQPWKFPSFFPKESLAKVRGRAWQLGLPYPRYTLGTMVTASIDGLTVWTGYLKVSPYLQLPWQTIDDIRATDMYFDGYRHRGLELTSSEFPGGSLQLLLQNPRLLGLFPISKKSLAEAESYLRSNYFDSRRGCEIDP